MNQMITSSTSSQAGLGSKRPQPASSTGYFPRPAGPISLTPLGPLSELRADGAFFVHRVVRKYGDLSYFRIANTHFYLVNDPDEIHRVMSGELRRFNKDRTMKKGLGRFIGNGLTANDGESWKRQRQLIQPAFKPMRLAAYSEVMQACADRWFQRFEANKVHDMEEMATHYTMDVVTRTMFGADIFQVIDTRALDDAIVSLQNVVRSQLGSLIDLPRWLPTPRNRRAHHAVKTTDELVYRLVDERRRRPEYTNDFLSLLLAARDDAGVGMTEKQLRDELVTMFIAGQESASNALCWTWYLLARHPEVEAEVLAEVDREIGARPLDYDSVRRLVFTEAVLLEAMRLYPPAPLLAREAIAPYRIGAYDVPKGSVVLISPYAVHRHPLHFSNPEAFRPARFLPEARAGLHPFAYLPFGAGPRRCIAMTFSIMEMQIAIATLARSFRLMLGPGQTVEPEALVTMHPKNGLPMRLVPRR